MVKFSLSALLLLVASLSHVVTGDATTVRFATFNVALNRNNAGELIQDLSVTNTSQIESVAEIIQRVRPDVLLLNEFDYDDQGENGGSLGGQLFQEHYLGVPQQNDVNAIEYPHVFVAPSNTGINSGVDFDNNNSTSDPNDAFGFGFFEGQYAMIVFSMYPITDSRTFQTFLWKDMPDALWPMNEDGSSYYSEEAMEVFRLSSKSHWDLSIEIPVGADTATVHLLASHPTPPVFDGPEDRNGRRNYDEIRFWKDYVHGMDYMTDDEGMVGGLPRGAHFVIAGDQNADPFDGDSYDGAINLLLDDELVNTELTPSSNGGTAQALLQAGVNLNHTGDPAYDTADWGFNGPGNPDAEPGNARADYCLPSITLPMVDAGVFWPAPDEELFPLAEYPTSDHRLVYVDVQVMVVEDMEMGGEMDQVQIGVDEAETEMNGDGEEQGAPLVEDEAISVNRDGEDSEPEDSAQEPTSSVRSILPTAMFLALLSSLVLVVL